MPEPSRAPCPVSYCYHHPLLLMIHNSVMKSSLYLHMVNMELSKYQMSPELFNIVFQLVKFLEHYLWEGIIFSFCFTRCFQSIRTLQNSLRFHSNICSSLNFILRNHSSKENSISHGRVWCEIFIYLCKSRAVTSHDSNSFGPEEQERGHLLSCKYIISGFIAVGGQFIWQEI